MFRRQVDVNFVSRLMCNLQADSSHILQGHYSHLLHACFRHELASLSMESPSQAS